MFTLTFPCQVVNLQDINAFARSNSLLFYGQQQENADTQDFMMTTTLF
jgi:hypothetical protein